MKTQAIIENIQNQIVKVQAAKTYEEKERQFIANSCKKLYNFIEDTLEEKYGEEAMVDAFNDLLRGDFAEPYHCEMKKAKFRIYAEIYIKIVK